MALTYPGNRTPRFLGRLYVRNLGLQRVLVSKPRRYAVPGTVVQE